MIERLGDGRQSPQWASGKTAPDQSPRSPNRRSSSSPWWGQDYSLDWRSHPGLAETTRPRCSRRQSSLWLLSAQPDIGLGIPAPPALAFGWRLTPLVYHPERSTPQACEVEGSLQAREGCKLWSTLRRSRGIPRLGRRTASLGMTKGSCAGGTPAPQRRPRDCGAGLWPAHFGPAR